MDPKKQHSRFTLLERTPVLAVSANASGIAILGEDGKYSRFLHYDRTLQARIDAHNKPAHAHFEASSPVQRVLNSVQRSMYRRVMYGLKEFNPEQIAAMDSVQRERVVRDHQKCNDVLHRLKVDVYYAPYNKLINALCPHMKHSPIGTKTADYKVRLPADATLNKLKIGIDRVVASLMNARLLPADFFTLEPGTFVLR